MSIPPLDLLLRRDPGGTGRVWTSGGDQRLHAVGVRDGRVVALDEDALAQRGRGTEEVDLTGRMLLPGFQDAHVHAVFAGVTIIRCDLAGLDGEGAQRRIVESSILRPAGWVLGGGWSFDTFGRTPTAADLDLLIGDRPGWLTIRGLAAPCIRSTGSARSSAVSTATTRAEESSSPHGVCLPNDLRYHSPKSVRPDFRASRPDAS